MNGYDAIMQGRHGLRNTTQPNDTEYGLLSVYSFRGKYVAGAREGRKESERGEAHGAVSPTRIYIERGSSVRCRRFFGYPISRSVRAK